jgi:hypothetical protein
MLSAASKGMHVGKLLASWRRKISLAVHVAYADNVLRGLSVAADVLEVASSSIGVPSHATAFFTRAMGRKRSLYFLERRVRRRLPQLVAFPALRGSLICIGLCIM